MYTKVVQFGNTTLVYRYDRELVRKKSCFSKKNKIKRLRSKKSILRSTQNFYRLINHNVYNHSDLPVMMTFTTFEDISLDDGYRALSAFFARLKAYYAKSIQKQQSESIKGLTLSYISVPEWQKKSGFLHYHALVWGLPKVDCSQERSTRLFQRFWRRGYVDVRFTTYKSPRLSGYLAKYFSKSQEDRRTYGRRSYSSSRNIFKPYEVGSNSLAHYLQHIIDENQLEKKFKYNTLWLGQCELSVYTNNNKKI